MLSLFHDTTFGAVHARLVHPVKVSGKISWAPVPGSDPACNTSDTDSLPDLMSSSRREDLTSSAPAVTRLTLDDVSVNLQTLWTSTSHSEDSVGAYITTCVESVRREETNLDHSVGLAELFSDHQQLPGRQRIRDMLQLFILYNHQRCDAMGRVD